MTTSMNLPMHLGAINILAPRLETLSLLRDIGKYRPTALMGVPALYDGSSVTLMCGTTT
jgi:long-subunit acyl-CoA synthetase (AMP-forming)